MKPRDSYRYKSLPDSHRVWEVDLGEPKGAHGFRFPSWAMADKVQELTSKALADLTDRKGERFLRQLSPWMGLVIGSCWWHRGFDLSTEHPGWRADDDALLEFGAAVADELQDADYRLLEVSSLYTACAGAMQERLSIVSRARERADFSDSVEAAPAESQGTASAGERTEMGGSTSSPRTSA